MKSCYYALSAAAMLLALSSGLARAQLAKPDIQAAAAGKWRDVSIEDYRQHLLALETATAACAKGRDLKTCDPLLVGPDDRIPWGHEVHAERRLVRYGWLRVLFSKAEDPDEATKPKSGAAQQAEAGPKTDVRTTSQLLLDAQKRLAADIAQSDVAAAGAPAHDSERAVLQQVLTGREFRNLKQPDARDSVLEKLSNWLNKLFDGLGKLQTRSAWLGRALIWGFLLAVAVGVMWLLLQMERRWRVRLVPESEGPAPGAASARDWQLWLADARRAAAAGQWRDAIHFMYWAAISRLESKRVWPADRARTPREYLALVAGDDPRKPGLGALTREFEVTWYGGRYAGEGEYRRAEELAQGLFESGAAAREGAR